MSFISFRSISDVQTAYSIRYEEGIFVEELHIKVSDTFLNELRFNRENIDVFSSEAARSELIISPLLREVYKRHTDKYAFWIQKTITFDDVLSGTPDYIFSKKSALGKTVLESPIVIVVEAKKNDFEQGWGQCLAELVASKKINKSELKPVYGVVTDGNLWQFGRLAGHTFTKNERNYTIDNVQELYGALEFIADVVAREPLG